MTSGDRRTVSVLFADLSDFTGLGEQLDPEEVVAVVHDTLRGLVEEARSCGGWLEKQIGDAILAVFGAPVAHEDDPTRAVAAALAMQRRMLVVNERRPRGVPELKLHIGVNTGLVVRGPAIDAAQPDDFIVIGDTVNTAKRFQEAAGPGQIVVGEATFAATRDAFDYRPLGHLSLKGKQERVAAYECRGERARRDEQPAASTLVGRERELAALGKLVADLERGRGGVVAVSGEPGVGKSRLVLEARRRTEPRVRWLEGRALPFGRTISYWPFLEIIRRDAGIAEEDGEAASWAKLRRRLEEVVAGGAAELLPYLGALLALEPRGEHALHGRRLDGEAMGRQIFRASRRYFERLAAEEPLVLLFEDWHWADASSRELLDHLLPLASRLPLLVCCVTRPEAERPAGAVEVALAPLSRAETVRLACDLLELDDLSARAREAIYQKTEGNPFFVEEVVRALIELGLVARDEATGGWRARVPVDDIALPDTLRGVIMARVDRLDEQAKHVLRLAAVVGRAFHDRVLRAVAGDTELDHALAELRALDLIRVSSTSPELEYAFKHALVRDAVYDSILLRRRAELHARVGECVESLFADRSDEVASLLAYHFAEADDWERSLAYLLRAGDRAGAIAADAEAIAHYRRAHDECLRRFGATWDPLQRARLERKLGEALARRGDHDEAELSFERALRHLGSPYPSSRFRIRLALVAQLLTQIGHRLRAPRPRSGEAEILVERAANYHGMAWLHYFTDREKLALDAITQLNVAERCGDVTGMARGSDGMGLICDVVPLARTGDYYHRRSVALAEQARDPTLIGQAHLGLCAHDHSVLGRWDDALADAERSADAYRRAGDVRGWGVAQRMLSGFLAYRGELERGLEAAREVVAAGEDAAQPQVAGWGLHGMGISLWRMGELAEARERLELAIDVLRAVPDHRAAVMATGDLGHCLLEAGEVDAALARLADAQTLIAEQKLRGFSCTPVATALAEASLTVAERAPGDERAALMRKARRACRAARRQARVDATGRPAAYRLQGTYCWLRGRRRQAGRWWGRSLAAAAALGARHDEGLTALERGRRTGREADLGRAEALLEAAGARLGAERARMLLAGAGAEAPAVAAVPRVAG